MPWARPLENLIGLSFGLTVNCFHLRGVSWLTLTHAASELWESAEDS